MSNFEQAMSECGPTIAYWGRRAVAMGLNRDDVEQELMIKLQQIDGGNRDLRLPIGVYFKSVARNHVLDLQRGCKRRASRSVRLEEPAEVLPSRSSERHLANAEFQIDLEHAGLSEAATRYIRVVLEHGARRARPAFGGTSREFYRARDEVAAFLVGRMSKRQLGQLLGLTI